MPVELLSPPVGCCGWLSAYHMVARPVAAEQAVIGGRVLLPRNDREYGDRPDNYPLELVLQLEGLDRRTRCVLRPRSQGFAGRLRRSLLDKHFRVAGRTTWYESVEQMQEDFDQYLHHCNHAWPR